VGLTTRGVHGIKRGKKSASSADSAKRPKKAAVAPAKAARARAEPSGRQRKINVFISYARNGHVIARVLHDELSTINPDRVHCFLDTEAIESGEGWEKKLESALAAADWLVCIYTGEQSEFCGYEIGVFTKGKALEKTAATSRLVCLHDVAVYPTVFRGHQNRKIEFPPETTNPAETFDETGFYERTEVARFLADFCKYENIYTADGVPGFQRQLKLIISKAKLITEAFRTAQGEDIRADTPTQLGIEVSLHWTATGQLLPAIPDTAQVKGTYQSFSLFGLMPHMEGEQLPVGTWAEIKNAGRSRGHGYLPWLERLERDMLAAANKLALGDAEATFRSGSKTYRAILVRHFLHRNGMHRFVIVFVETLPRQFIGDASTSLILAGLVMASRFRFAYFEDRERTRAKFDDKTPEQDFEANYRQFLYDLERMRQESMELGLLDETAFIQSFGSRRRGMAESFMRVWYEAKTKLEAALPSPETTIDRNNRKAVKTAIETFLATMGDENSRFLLTAVDAYRDELTMQLRKTGDRMAEVPA
jgi:TIR domain